MYRVINNLFLSTLIFFIVSCVSADDRTLSPPSENPDFNKINAKLLLINTGVYYVQWYRFAW